MSKRKPTLTRAEAQTLINLVNDHYADGFIPGEVFSDDIEGVGARVSLMRLQAKGFVRVSPGRFGGNSGNTPIQIVDLDRFDDWYKSEGWKQLESA